MKNFFPVLLTLLFLSSASSFAQFNSGKNTAGVLIGFGGGGLSGTGSIPPISLEYNFYKYDENIQLGLFGSYSGSTEELGMNDWEWSYTYIIVAAQGNYHFSPGEMFDPFVGLSLGYNVASISFEGSNKPAYLTEPSAGGIFYSGQAGFNYWFNESMAVQVRVGYYPYIAAGLTIGM
ncbi:MAG: hypothetical protein R6W90_15720 [Ignavibacteriaceae bacterium]